MAKKPVVAREIFISHAASDKLLAQAFERLLTGALGVQSAQIFCSSLEGQGVPKGKNFVDYIKKQVGGAKVVVALISPAYLDSAFCTAELGAAWVLGTERFPVVVPPTTFGSLDATLLGITGVRVNDKSALTTLLNDMAEALGIELQHISTVNRIVEAFMADWKRLRNKVAPASRIEATVHSAAIADREEALAAKASVEEELNRAKSQIAALEKAKDKQAVAKIAEEFDDSDWETRYDELMSELNGLVTDLGGKRVARLLALEALGKPSQPNLREEDDEITRAIELDVYDVDGRTWNTSNPDVNRFWKLMKGVRRLFETEEMAAPTLRRRGQQSNPDNIRFWEEHL
ncbi:MAG: toll/interleukin-1 receptor domain-containing protein [Rhizobiaceae bacterium]